MRRSPQLRTAFSSGRPLENYYNDLSSIALRHETPTLARRWLERTFGDRMTLNPVSVVQLGLAAWQVRDRDPAWADVVRDVTDWLVADMDERGFLAYRFRFGHTYDLEPPWWSAMAQGQAASLLLRAAAGFADPSLGRAAVRAASSLVEVDSPVVAHTDDGPVLQEYPTDPPSHVLNGWIFALWALNDLGAAGGAVTDDDRRRAGEAFRVGSETLARRLPLYRVWPRWSRYDLFPHPIAHVASPFYHRLHIEMLAAMSELAPNPVYHEIEAEWESGARSGSASGCAVARKVAFRLVRPRSQWVRLRASR